VTGLIPAKKGDIIRFKNMEYLDINQETPSYNTTLFVYSDSFEKLGSVNHTPSSLPEEGLAPVYGSNGDVIQLNVPSWSSSIAYIRISCSDLNESSIITINEEIA
jgi:hypothetical protein